MDLELWETGGGSALATLASGVTVTSEASQVVSGTCDASLLTTADGSAVELRVVGHASTDAGNERAVEVGATQWSAARVVGGPELYFLRARYYDPNTGRFLSKDVIETANRYTYAFSNPVLYLDPNGEWGIPKPTCGICGRIAGEAADKIGDCASSSTCRTWVGTGALVAGTVAVGPLGAALVGVGAGTLLATDARDCIGGAGVSCGSFALGVASLGTAQLVTKVPAVTVRAARTGLAHELMLRETSAALANLAIKHLPRNRTAIAGGVFGISRSIYQAVSGKLHGASTSGSMSQTVVPSATE